MQSLLQYIGKYVNLTLEEQKLVVQTFRKKRYLKGQFIVQSGDICRYESYILSGSVKAFFVDPEGNEHVVMLGIEDWWVGDLASFSQTSPADLDIQCLEDTQVAQITEPNLENLFSQIPKMERFFRIIILRHLIFTQKRLIENLSLPAKERYLKFSKRYSSLEQRFPQYLIASYLGMSKEFLSKIRNEMASKS